MVGFQPISGEHSGENLGKYFVGLCDRVGITSEKHSKVRRKAVCGYKILLITIFNWLAASEHNTR